jgi:hypothetical protein
VAVDLARGQGDGRQRIQRQADAVIALQESLVRCGYGDDLVTVIRRTHGERQCRHRLCTAKEGWNNEPGQDVTFPHGLEPALVIRHQEGLLNERCTLRRVTHGVGVERIFLVHSPRIEKIEVIRLGKVRRARLYYLRSRIGARATRIKERQRV